MLLTMQSKWAFTKRLTFSTPQRKYPISKLGTSFQRNIAMVFKERSMAMVLNEPTSCNYDFILRRK